MTEGKINKIREKMSDLKYMLALKTPEKEIHTIKVSVEGKPEAYARERSSRGHFYNPKSTLMTLFKKEVLHKMSTDDYNFTRELLKSNKDFHVEISAQFYLPIQENSSIKDAILKEQKEILPIGKPDTDNFCKFILDSLHDVFYNDDSCVTKVEGAKYYSLNPRTDLVVKIITIEDDTKSNNK